MDRWIAATAVYIGVLYVAAVVGCNLKFINAASESPSTISFPDDEDDDE